MPIQPCPHCGHETPTWLQTVSLHTKMNHYLCLSCRHIWTALQDGAAVSVARVSPLKLKPHDRNVARRGA